MMFSDPLKENGDVDLFTYIDVLNYFLFTLYGNTACLHATLLMSEISYRFSIISTGLCSALIPLTAFALKTFRKSMSGIKCKPHLP